MIIAIRGEPGSGKTTTCKNLISKIYELKLNTCGFITSEIRDLRGERIGFEIQTLNGQKAIFSSIFIRSNFRVGKYYVDIKTFEELALPSLVEFELGNCNLLIVDEVGKMELLSKNFLIKIKKVLNLHNKGYLIFTLPISDFHPIIKEIHNNANRVFFTSRKNKNSEETALKIFHLLKDNIER